MTKSKKFKAEVTLKIEGVVRNGISIENLIKSETEFLLEPLSTNGCVTKVEVKETHT